MHPIGHSKARSQDEDTVQWVQEHVFTVPEFYYGVGDPHLLMTTFLVTQSTFACPSQA